MNTHSLNHKLKTALTRRTREQGFAMPVALGLGLVMALVGITVIVRSQGDRVASSAQKATAGGLSAAETGIARYQSLINANRPIAMYPACNSWSSGSSCNDTGAVTSWGNAVSIPAYGSTCTTSSGVPGTSVISAKATRDWQNIDSTDPTKGQFRLIDYTYSGTPGSPGGTGTLTVEGRVNQSGSGTAATKSAGTSTTRLQVTIPVQKNNRSSPIPGLWVKDPTVTLGNGSSIQQVFGNILIAQCPSPPPTLTITQAANILDLPGTTTKSGDIYINKEMDMPSTPDMTTVGTVNQADGSALLTNLPRAGDVKGNDGKYYYLVDSLSAGGGTNLTVTPGAQVIIFVKGDISTSGSAKINSPGFPQSLQIYGNTSNPPGSATPTKYGCGTRTNPAIAVPNCPTVNVQIQGNGGISALILAPDSTAGVGGGGSSGTCTNVSPPNGLPPKGNFVGAVWANKFAGNGSGMVICSYGNFSDYVATAAAAQSPWAGIPFTNGWQRLEATP
jgi:Tfp pilus assembly protein PilX